jgi:hypothetical protein
MPGETGVQKPANCLLGEARTNIIDRMRSRGFRFCNVLDDSCLSEVTSLCSACERLWSSLLFRHGTVLRIFSGIV